MSCDATCRDSSGNLNSRGYVLNFLEVADFSNNNGYFIRAGYETDPTTGVVNFFEDYHTAQQTYSLGFDGPAVDYGNNENPPPFFVRVLIYASTGVGACPTFWQDILEFTIPNQGLLWLGNAAFCSTFKPTVWVMGQYLYGTKGASARTADFINNLYSTIPRMNCVGCEAAPLTLKDAVFLTKDGTLVSRGAPPYAGWDVRPHVANSEGGSFYAECCQPPP
jgi:hypothetical protein